MKKLLYVAVLAAALAAPAMIVGGCQTTAGQAISNIVAPSTPEAQIKAGADSLTAATVLATTLLKNDKITVEQAKSYRAILGSASAALDDMNGALVKCREATASTQATSPDPCKLRVVDVINVALTSISSVRRALDAKS